MVIRDAVVICGCGHSPLADGRVKAGSDEFAVVSHAQQGGTVLVITGGRGRAALYGVYAFFEEAAGCHYFWDGDVVPWAKQVDITDMDLYEAPQI